MLGISARDTDKREKISVQSFLKITREKILNPRFDSLDCASHLPTVYYVTFNLLRIFTKLTIVMVFIAIATVFTLSFATQQAFRYHPTFHLTETVNVSKNFRCNI